MNKRGFAAAGMLYSLLILFLLLTVMMLNSMQNKKTILDNLKSETVEALYCTRNECDLFNSYGNASANEILSGKTALVKGKKVIGKMKTVGASTISLKEGEFKEYELGYYSKNWKVSCEKSKKIGVGNYIKMTPTSTSYTVSSSLTGYSNNQIINPSELNLWRVININNDGSIDVISENISSNSICFQGTTGYSNFLESLQTISEQYTNSNYTRGAKYIGYKKQESINLPNNSNNNNINFDKTNNDESEDSIDEIYEKDYVLAKYSIGDLSAKKLGEVDSSDYWLASRYTDYMNTSSSYGRRPYKNYAYYIDTSGLNKSTILYEAYSRCITNPISHKCHYDIQSIVCKSVRPMVTLKSKISVASGSGTKNDPYILSPSPNKFEVGDYVKMKPTSSSYNISSSLTGYNKTQTINPSELDLWRIIKINSDGTIDMVSEYLSNNEVYFNGSAGYAKFIGTLNDIAKQYSNDKYTIKTRYMGYSNQTQKLGSFYPYRAPSTLSTSSVTTSADETKGAGDMGYQNDVELVQTALGTLKAYSISDETMKYGYWLASRYFKYSDSASWYFSLRNVNKSGYTTISSNFLNYKNGSLSQNAIGYRIRPIITLKAGIITGIGEGTKNSPYVLN